MNPHSAATRAADPLLADLNDAQRQAVLHVDGPLLVLAGPGSGKTRVVTRRAAHLVRSGVPTRNILAITFTNKAADEMKQRIEALGVAAGMWIYTFHALGVRLLREFGPLAGVQPGFTIYDEADRLACVKKAMEICQIGESTLRPENAVWAISRAKNELHSPDEAAAAATFPDQREGARVYGAYQQLLAQSNAVDFDDLLMRVAIVLRDNADVVERLNIRFRYVLIDEYQDTNQAQYLIAQQLSRHHRNICATGDPDQSIYGWRGANLGNILGFERDYPDARVVRLEQNYRSTGAIVALADRLIQANRRRKHKTLWTENPPGEPARLWAFRDDRGEAERIAQEICTLNRQGRPFSDFAIFYRVNSHSRGIEDALRAARVPYRICRGVAFYGRREVKDALAYLRLVVNPADDVALLRAVNTPPRGIGKVTIERIFAAAAQRGCTPLEVIAGVEQHAELRSAARHVRAFHEVIRAIADASHGSVSGAVSAALTISGLEAALREERVEGGEDRLANVQELVTSAKQYEEEHEQPTLEDFLHGISLVSDQDEVDQEAGIVLLMTLHAAKGLEFPVVFLTGAEQGTLPHERVLRIPKREDAERELEEERRLCFVGLTRARQRLYVSYARQRMVRGTVVERSPSGFVFEMNGGDMLDEDFSRVAAASSRYGDDAGDEGGGRSPRYGDSGERVIQWGSTRGAARDREDSLSQSEMIAKAAAASDSPYATWRAGDAVVHKRYGKGVVRWIRPDGAKVRGCILFGGAGEKTFVLNDAPIHKL